MDDPNVTIAALTDLGTLLRNYCGQTGQGGSKWAAKLDQAVVQAGQQNGWFTRENVFFALEQWGRGLTQEGLAAWLAQYDLSRNRPKTVGLVLAGNIPLVGLHDLLAVLLTGNRALVRPSSNDRVLPQFICEFLTDALPKGSNRMELTQERFTDFDAIIATGSNNTARYFEYYFGARPHIIRKNRSSVAVLTGKETQDQLTALGHDVFRYFGLGCRSVSKLYVPTGYDFDAFFKAIYPYNRLLDHQKYANNYDYNKAVYLMSEFKILDNGFLMLKEDTGFGSPIATLFYEPYQDQEALAETLRQHADKLQCVVGQGPTADRVPFGATQTPSLTDYADNVDTIDFLLRS